MNLPPKSLPARIRKGVKPDEPTRATEVVANRPAAGAASVAPNPDAVELSPENLPVLHAFQRFLEVERRKTRRRLLAVSFTFLFILIAVSGGATWLGAILFSELRRDFDDIERSVAASQDTSIRLQDDTREALRALELQRQKLMDEYEKDRRIWTTGQSDVTTTLRQQETALQEIRAMVDSLKEDTRQAPPVTAAPQPTTPPPVPLAPDAAEPPATPPPTRMAQAPMTLRLTPVAGHAQINWRLPIPE